MFNILPPTESPDGNRPIPVGRLYVALVGMGIYLSLTSKPIHVLGDEDEDRGSVAAGSEVAANEVSSEQEQTAEEGARTKE